MRREKISISGWAFATVNRKLAEIYFDTKKEKSVILGHCYVNQNEYQTKQERKWILGDTKKYKFIYRNKKYKQVKISKPK